MRELLIALLGASLLAACNNDDDNNVSPQQRLAEIEQQIDALAVETPCGSANQCTSLPLGALACGGPSKYKPLSTLASNRNQAELLASEHRNLSQSQLGLDNGAGPCVVPTQPQYQCLADKCVAS